jgi:DNA-directed RNA polymerase specialized sigma24 family protein
MTSADRQEAKSTALRLRALQRHVDQLAADSDLVFELALHRYEGPRWSRFAAVLAEYGVAVLRPWIASGKVYAELGKKGRHLQRDRRFKPSEDDALEMASETVARAIRHFREKVLMPGKWQASGGASLHTYFIGQCLFQFPDVYRRCLREQCLEPDDWRGFDPEFRHPDSVEAPAELRRLLSRAEPLSAELLVAAADGLGHSHVEISRMSGLTVRAVESRIYRFVEARGGE